MKTRKPPVKATGIDLEMLTLKAVMRSVGRLPTLSARARLLEYAGKLVFEQDTEPKGQIAIPGAIEGCL